MCTMLSPGFQDSEKKRHSCHLKIVIWLMSQREKVVTSSHHSLIPTPIPTPNTEGKGEASVTTVIAAGRMSRVPPPTPREKGQAFGGNQMADHRGSQASSHFSQLLLHAAAPPPLSSLQNLEGPECNIHVSRVQPISFTNGASTTLSASVEECSNVFVERMNEL